MPADLLDTLHCLVSVSSFVLGKHKPCNFSFQGQRSRSNV